MNYKEFFGKAACFVGIHSDSAPTNIYEHSSRDGRWFSSIETADQSCSRCGRLRSVFKNWGSERWDPLSPQAKRDLPYNYDHGKPKPKPNPWLW